MAAAAAAAAAAAPTAAAAAAAPTAAHHWQATCALSRCLWGEGVRAKVCGKCALRAHLYTPALTIGLSKLLVVQPNRVFLRTFNSGQTRIVRVKDILAVSGKMDACLIGENQPANETPLAGWFRETVQGDGYDGP